YFPLVVDSAFMVEPTETESKEDIDHFINAVKAIAKDARENAEKLHQAPTLTKVRRMDEVSAARKPCLKG
ncbi:MAG: aminomethyl-transferring glycine dehydrogenase subunit GcvPB, partial [Desulfobacterales bacterium]|nr:aminomethyl-transferring glycine dehydrogenase subunit GcvPB [Desulfobacterales bacterium]